MKPMIAIACMALLLAHSTSFAEDSHATATTPHACKGESEEAAKNFNLGIKYSTGIDEKLDLAKAVEYFQLAADQGCAEAQCNLALMYISGRGVAKDMIKASDLLWLSAKQFNAEALSLLTLLCSNDPAVKTHIDQKANVTK